jgi:uncharacterized cupin superfamily protein
MNFSITDLPRDEMISKKTGEKFSLSAVLSDALNFKDMFVHHDIIPPGRRSSASHAHSKREEMIFVLSGTPTLNLRGESKVLKPGDFVGLTPGAENAHFLANCTNDDICVLVIASNPANDDVIYTET